MSEVSREKKQEMVTEAALKLFAVEAAVKELHQALFDLAEAEGYAVPESGGGGK